MVKNFFEELIVGTFALIVGIIVLIGLYHGLPPIL
ncbi:MAG: hypothetical protein LAKADJCE_00553 [Candidatus Argoarchaeum ethanivorans]|uniref:Uncharacterized protein n=1 Tax=Candidatus Argoarchaeum ethanivorans TaxID=2608793 RepID=A0A811TFU0_9EURY|nr:MAG: hypothetical protein LAKADJCE_00553 [Candidatus Argoarchaeum ethanivorans]